MADSNDDADSIDGVDLALALAHGSPEARALIAKQSRLIDAQETLARADLRHRGWQIIGERVGSLIKGLTALVGILFLLGIASFLWSASRASGMVMDPFSVPPTLDRQGLSGAVVAQQLLDKIAALETGTQSARAASSYENSLSDSKGVVVPYAGVSLGELRREARNWLGSENHVSGDVVQLPGGRIAISFRTLGESGRVEGDQTQFNSLMDQAAVAIFKATQPYRHAIWLSRHGGTSDQFRAIFTQLGKSPHLRERLWAFHGMANMASSSTDESRAYEERALKLRPGFLPALSNLPFYAQRAGHDEEAYRLLVASAEGLLGGADDYTPSHSKHYGLGAKAWIAELKGDKVGTARFRSESAEYTADDANTALGPFEAAAAWAAAHDFSAARAQLAAAGYLDPARRAEAEKLTGPQPDLKLLLAIATDDFATQASETLTMMENYRRAGAATTDAVARRTLLESADDMRPSAALLLARAGRAREAAAMIGPWPATIDSVLRVRAFVAAMSGEASADRLFAQAAARTPSLPAANLLWAEALLHPGDAVRAEAQAREALRRGPNSAQGYRLLGDALSAQRKYAEAEQSYSAAARLTPQWGALQMRWASALWRLGKRDEARAKLRAAGAMALNDADRLHLAAMMRKAASTA